MNFNMPTPKTPGDGLEEISDPEQAKAIEALLSKNSNKKLEQLKSKFDSSSESTNHFPQEKINEQVENLQSSIDDIKSTLSYVLKRFEDGRYKIGEPYTNTLLVAIDINHPAIMKYIAKTLNGQVRFNKENPEQIEAIDFIKTDTDNCEVVRSAQDENGKPVVDGIVSLSISPSEEGKRGVNLYMDVQRVEKQTPEKK